MRSNESYWLLAAHKNTGPTRASVIGTRTTQAAQTQLDAGGPRTRPGALVLRLTKATVKKRGYVSKSDYLTLHQGLLNEIVNQDVLLPRLVLIQRAVQFTSEVGLQVRLVHP